MDLIKKIVEWKAKELGVTRVYFIESRLIPLTWRAVMLCLDCKITNIKMMRRWSCPPYAINPDDVKEMLNRYPHALVINLEVKLFNFINRSWDTFDPFLQISQKLYCHFYWSKLHRIMLRLKVCFEQESIPHYAWGSSPCHACFKCSYPRKCRKPESFLVSPEASGIDLYQLAKNTGIPIEIPPRQKVQLMSIALFEA
jgi:predicted metal-binding protein